MIRRLPRSLPLLLCAAAAFLTAGCGIPSFDIHVPKETIMERIGHQFPVTKKNGAITLTLSNPRVEFKSAENRLGSHADLLAEMQGARPAHGEMECDGTLAYEDDAVAFTDAALKELQLNGRPDDSEQLKQLMAQSLLHELNGMKVYHIHPDDPKERFVAKALREVVVTDQGITIRLGGN